MRIDTRRRKTRLNRKHRLERKRQGKGRAWRKKKNQKGTRIKKMIHKPLIKRT